MKKNRTKTSKTKTTETGDTEKINTPKTKERLKEKHKHPLAPQQ